MPTPRFDAPSGSLSLRALLGRTRRGLLICCALGLAAHLALTRLAGVQGEEQVAKPLTTQFVKRQPRLTKPLELKKRPQPRRRTVQRKMVSVQAKALREGSGPRFEPTQALGGLAKPAVDVGRMGVLEGVGAEPEVYTAIVEGSKEAEDKIDMSLELLDIEALNTGKHHAMVIQDPVERKNIQGFCRLGVVFSSIIYPGTYPKFDDYIMPVVLNLADAMNRYTDIKTDIFGRITLDDAELLKTPWVYFMAFYNFRLPDGHLRGLGTYLTSGGFVFADTHPMPSRYAGGLHGLTGNIKAALQTQGIPEASFEKLPNSHPLYHCYFDFDAPPRAGDAHASSYHKPDYLEGIELDGHLAAILTTKGYWCPWAYEGPTARVKGPYLTWDTGRAFQFGVNLIIFALTQEGSITRRLMDSVQ